MGKSKVENRFPEIAKAGFVLINDGETVSKLLNSEIRDNTPEKIRKFRKTSMM